MLLGDLNVESSDPVLNDFCNVYSLFTLVTDPKCFKNPYNINLFLTNCLRSFQNTVTIETGISDFYKMIITVIKVFYKKHKPKFIQYPTKKSFHHSSGIPVELHWSQGKLLENNENKWNLWNSSEIPLEFQQFIILTPLKFPL